VNQALRGALASVSLTQLTTPVLTARNQPHERVAIAVDPNGALQ
jgi:hypothetical protein